MVIVVAVVDVIVVAGTDCCLLMLSGRPAAGCYSPARAEVRGGFVRNNPSVDFPQEGEDEEAKDARFTFNVERWTAAGSGE